MLRGICVVVIDCLRADHVSTYGYPRATTPTLDALAARGVLWERAYSASSWTRPSVPSILTGLYPSQHGLMESVKRSDSDRRTTCDVLRSSTPTLAERLSAGGWRCGAFINNAQLGEFSQLHRGFDVYHPSAGKADHLLESFRSWLHGDSGQPTFAYLHFLEAHFPYKPRRRHVAMFGGDRDTNFLRDLSARDCGKLRRDISRGTLSLSGSQLEEMIQMYDGAVRRLDGKLKVLLKMLDELKLADQFAIVVTSDHGEEFLEHGRIGHGQTLYDELVHVPLVMALPGQTSGERREGPVSLVDLAPTLEILAGASRDDDERNMLQKHAASRPIISELLIKRRYTQSIRLGKWKLHREFHFMPSNGELDRAMMPHHWVKAVPHEVSYEFYDMESDPQEKSNLAEEQAWKGVRSELENTLDVWWERVAEEGESYARQEIEVDEQVIQRLRDLGYVD